MSHLYRALSNESAPPTRDSNPKLTMLDICINTSALSSSRASWRR